MSNYSNDFEKIHNKKLDLISKEILLSYVDNIYKPMNVHVYQTLESTNQTAKELAKANAPHGTVVISEEQTMGRGRRGRGFFSPNGSGIYMSIITKSKENAEDMVLITTAASVAVNRAIKNVTGLDTQIKWVNDIYYKEKKVCGILAEAVNTPKSGVIHSIIVGIGINFVSAQNDFPEELRETATSLFETNPLNITRNQLCAEIINQLLCLYDTLEDRSYLIEYREKSLVLGKEILIIESSGSQYAKAVEIDNQGGLVVELVDGTRKVLNSGEISIRPKTNWK